MRDVDLSATPRTVTKVTMLLTDKVDAALCGPDGVRLFSGPAYYDYADVSELGPIRGLPQPSPITPAMMPCTAEETQISRSPH